MSIMIPTNMDHHGELKERREANECATSEFRRVKRAKLDMERAKKSSIREGTEEEKKKDREMANRASAAASRAKIVFYSKELEKRTDRLEMERNREIARADRAIRKLRSLKREMHTLKKVLRDLWEMKEDKTCSYLVDSNVLFLLGSRQDDGDTIATDSDEDMYNGSDNLTAQARITSPQTVPLPIYHSPVTPLKQMVPPPVCPPQVAQVPPTIRGSIIKNEAPSGVADLRHLIHPLPVGHQGRIASRTL